MGPCGIRTEEHCACWRELGMAKKPSNKNLVLKSRVSTKAFKAVLDVLYYSRGYKMFGPLTEGIGAILMLHSVRPEPMQDFDPNGILRVSPDFLEQIIDCVLEAGFDVISLDEVYWRLSEGDLEQPFVCFTFDDGYRDNWEHAYPIFQRYGLPLAIYVSTDFADGKGELWWLALENVIRHNDAVTIRLDGEERTFDCAGPDAKDDAYRIIYRWLRGINEFYARSVVADLCDAMGFDQLAICRKLLMTWQEIRTIARDPLVTIGAHTKGHYALAKLSLSDARFQVEENLSRLQQELGKRPEHFSFPYGCGQSAGPREFQLLAEVGVKTAVTTRKGMIFADHNQCLTALPRMSLNGEYQKRRYFDVLMSGVPFALWNRFRKVNAT